MYNRYIPQADGSYQKKQVTEPRRHAPSSPPPPPKLHPESCPVQKPCSDPPPPPPKPYAPPCGKQPQCRQEGILDFFKHLLPRNLDTADLLIILLLLLMASDCEEEKNTALLTLALYFFM